jgi:dimethylhistidine N-methyltransferase
MESVITRIDQTFDPAFEFGQDVLLGLSGSPKKIPSKWFYDAKGSLLFEKIMELPEYYPTRCEFEILTKRRDEFVDLLGPGPMNIVEVGPGDGRKSRILLRHLLSAKRDIVYTPVEISEAALGGLIETLTAEFPDLPITALIADAFVALNHVSQDADRKNACLVLGGTFGNLSAAEGKTFLRMLWNGLNAGDQVVIGFDLKKQIDLIVRAYDDAQGMTREFNLNLLRRINKELGGSFDDTAFMHYPTYNAKVGAMESYLLSVREQTVRVEALDREFHFEPWEAIHTETSHKHLVSEIEAFARETGFRINRHLFDSKRYFVDSIWTVEKGF